MANISKVIAPKLLGMEAAEQAALDAAMIELAADAGARLKTSLLEKARAVAG